MQTKVLVVLGILLLSLNICQARRGGGGGRSGGGRSRGGSRSSYGRGRSGSSSYKPKASQFDKGGFKKYAKMAAGVYVAKKLSPSIRFRGYRGTEYAYRSNTICHDCISINGSNPQCDDPSGNFTSQLPACTSTSIRPYCSIEYGVLNDNQTFVRRSCNERRCRSCSSDTRVGSDQCYTFQCDLCNWDRCNIGSVEKVFTSSWKGCLPDPSKVSNSFDTYKTCGSVGTIKPAHILISLVGLILAKLFN